MDEFDVDKWIKDMEDNFNEVLRKDREAKIKGVLVGRYVAFPWADGQSFYEITKENKATVRLRVITGVGDDWVLPAYGNKSSESKDYILRNIEGREWKESLNKKNKADVSL